MNILERKKFYLSRWSNGKELDERLMSFSEKFETWANQIPKKNLVTVFVLLDNLQYYSHSTTNSCLKELHVKMLKEHDVTDDNTIYVYIKSKDGQTNSSNDYWNEYKYINRINKHICFENMDAINEELWQYIQNIVFIDDFSGSGKSLTDELEKHPKRYENKNIFFVTICSMQISIDNIVRYCKEHDINYYPMTNEIHNKAFEQEYFENNQIAKDEITDMSRCLKIPDEEIMGFKKTQSLVVFYNNTPNNTLGFIRYDTDTYKSIFPRSNDPRPSWQTMNNRSIRRKNTNYKNKAVKKNGSV